MRVRVLATPGHTYTHLSYVLRGAGTRDRGVFSGGSLLFGATGRPDLLGPDHTDDLVHHQYASAHRLAAVLPDRPGYSHPRVRQLLLRHPVRGHRVDDRGGEDDQPGAHPGRGELRPDLLAGLDAFPAYYAQMGPANTAGPAAPDLTPPEPADPAAAAPAVRSRGMAGRSAHPHRLRRRARARAP